MQLEYIPPSKPKKEACTTFDCRFDQTIHFLFFQYASLAQYILFSSIEQMN